jgi:hypothetical protein
MGQGGSENSRAVAGLKVFTWVPVAADWQKIGVPDQIRRSRDEEIPINNYQDGEQKNRRTRLVRLESGYPARDREFESRSLRQLPTSKLRLAVSVFHLLYHRSTAAGLRALGFGSRTELMKLRFVSAFRSVRLTNDCNFPVADG